MGSGKKSPRVPVIDLRRDSVTSDGGPRVTCPQDGFLLVDNDSEIELHIGARGSLVTERKRLLFASGNLRLTVENSSASERLVGCIDAGIAYDGRLEMDDSRVVVRYQRQI